MRWDPAPIDLRGRSDEERHEIASIAKIRGETSAAAHSPQRGNKVVLIVRKHSTSKSDLDPSIILRPLYLGLVGNLDHFTFHGIRFCLSTAGFLFATSFRDLAFSTIRTFVRLVALDGLISQVRFLLSTPKTIAAEMQSWLQLRPQAKLSSTQQSTFFRFTISLSAYWLLVYPSSASKGSESKDICRKQCSQQGFDHENLRYHPSFVPTPSTSRVRRAKTPS